MYLGTLSSLVVTTGTSFSERVPGIIMVRVDHGTESCLLLFIQNLLRNERGNIGCEPHMQMRSRQVGMMIMIT